MLYFCLAVLALVVALTLGVRRSRSGRLLLASRDNLKAAEAASVPSVWIRLSGFVFAGSIAGLAGGLHMLVNNGARGGSYAPCHVGGRVLPHHHRRTRLGSGRHRGRRARPRTAGRQRHPAPDGVRARRAARAVARALGAGRHRGTGPRRRSSRRWRPATGWTWRVDRSDRAPAPTEPTALRQPHRGPERLRHQRAGPTNGS